jgi:hypothetical protein
MDQGKAIMLAEALESGCYIQGFRVLERHTRNEDGTMTVTNCCLGVATRLAMANGLHVTEEHCKRGVVEFDGDACALNPKVQAWFGFKTKGGDFESDSLIGLNDTKQHDFDDIARIIRENWELL